MADGREDETRANWTRPLIAGALVSACLVVALAISINRASAAFDAWSTVVGLMLSMPFSLASAWFASTRLSRLAGSPATTLECFWANVMSVSVSVVAPGRLFEAVKPVMLNLRVGLPVARGLAAVALERLLDVGCLAMLAALAVAGAASQYAEGLREAALVLSALMVVGVAILMALAAWPDFAGRLASRLPFAWLRNFAAEMVTALVRAGNWRALLMPALHSLLVWGASYLLFWMLLAYGGAIPLSPMQILVVFIAGTLGFIVTVTPGGLGTFEGAVVLALASFGYPVPDALALAILLRIANILPAIAASAWFLGQGSFRIGDLFARLRRRREAP